MRNKNNHTPMSQAGMRLTDFAFVPPYPVTATEAVRVTTVPVDTRTGGTP